MATTQQVGDLEVGQDLPFQQRSWTAQRIGWLVMGVFLLLALLGLLGKGPLCDTTAGDKDGTLWLEYERFYHNDTAAPLRFHVVPAPEPDGQARLWLARSYLDKVQIEHITPQPEVVEAGSDRLTYVFRVAEPGRPTGVTFFVTPKHIGPLAGSAGLINGPDLHFDQFVYP